MADLPVLRPVANGSGTAPQLRQWAIQDYSSIDDPVSAPDGGLITGPFAASGTTSFLLADMPSDFVSMDTLSFAVRAKVANRVDDHFVFYLRIVDSAGTLLTDNIIVDTTFGGTLTSALTNYSGTFATVVDGDKATWDGAILVLQQTYLVTGGTDAFSAIQVDAVEFTGTYTAGTSETEGSGDISGVGTFEGAGYKEPLGSGDISGAGSLEGVGQTVHSGSGEIVGVGEIEGDGDAGFLPPLVFTATAVTPTRIDLAWGSSDGAVFYELERERWDGSDWVESELTTYVEGLSYSDTSVVPQKQYRYRVRSVGA